MIHCIAISPDSIHISYFLPLLDFSEGDDNSSSENSDVESELGDVRCMHTIQFHYIILCYHSFIYTWLSCQCVCVCACACMRVGGERRMCMNMDKYIWSGRILHAQCMYCMCSTCKHFSTTYSAENITWTEQLTPITVESFNKTAGPKVPIPRSAKEIFLFFFTPSHSTQANCGADKCVAECMGQEKYQKWDKRSE